MEFEELKSLYFVALLAVAWNLRQRYSVVTSQKAHLRSRLSEQWKSEACGYGAGVAMQADILMIYVVIITIVISLDIYSISGQLEVNVEFLIQIDKLVQLIESPIFTCKYAWLYLGM